MQRMPPVRCASASERLGGSAVRGPGHSTRRRALRAARRCTSGRLRGGAKQRPREPLGRPSVGALSIAGVDLDVKDEAVGANEQSARPAVPGSLVPDAVHRTRRRRTRSGRRLVHLVQSVDVDGDGFLDVARFTCAQHHRDMHVLVLERGRCAAGCAPRRRRGARFREAREHGLHRLDGAPVVFAPNPLGVRPRPGVRTAPTHRTLRRERGIGRWVELCSNHRRREQRARVGWALQRTRRWDDRRARSVDVLGRPTPRRRCGGREVAHRQHREQRTVGRPPAAPPFGPSNGPPRDGRARRASVGNAVHGRDRPWRTQ
jgi:hypothetical protein